MHRFFCFVLLASAAVAQQDLTGLFNKPPAGVEDALRARVTEFYQDHVDSKFRAAEGLVAEEIKDFFYSGNKPHYYSFEIREIKWLDSQFTHARVTTQVEQTIPVAGFMDKPVKIPLNSEWKLENGKWCWWVDLNASRETPFGKLPPLSAAASADPNAKLEMPSTSHDFENMIKADRTEVALKAGASATVTIASAAPGPVSLSVVSITGVEASFDHSDLPAGGKAVLTLRATSGKPAGKVVVLVNPFNMSIPIQIKAD